MAYISKKQLKLRRKELEDEGQYLQCILYVLITCLLKNEVLSTNMEAYRIDDVSYQCG